jgi:hypothetical protein
MLETKTDENGETAVLVTPEPKKPKQQFEAANTHRFGNYDEAKRYKDTCCLSAPKVRIRWRRKGGVFDVVEYRRLANG